VERAQTILGCLRGSEGGMSEAAIAAATEISRRTVTRIIHRLEADRQVVRDHTVLDSRGRHIPQGG
jgi:DNA-binding IclR family transcriptional regulator